MGRISVYIGCMKKLLEFLGLVLLLACAVLVAHEVYAQDAVTPKAAPSTTSAVPSSAEVAELVTKEFGDKFKIVSGIAPIVGDFDGDGHPDLLVVASGDNPLMGEGAYHYKTLDPYNASFGFGNPRVTMAFNTSEGPARYLLILHSWKNPGKKFVLVNVPFTQLRLGHMMLKKKSLDAIESIDSTGIQGAIYWDGKKYKWEIIGSELDKN